MNEGMGGTPPEAGSFNASQEEQQENEETVGDNAPDKKSGIVFPWTKKRIEGDEERKRIKF